MNPIEVLQFVGVPLLIATCIIVSSWWLLPTKRLQPLSAILAVGVSALVAFVLQEGFPAIPPTEKWHSLVFTVLIVSMFACIYPLFRKWNELVVLQAIIAGIIVAFVMQFPGQSSLFDRVIVFFLVLFVSVGLRRITIPPWHMYVSTWWILAGISILALQSNFAKLAFFSGAMSAVSASLLVLQRVKPRETKSVQMILGVLIVGCSLCGLAYSQDDNILQFMWFTPMASVPIAAIAYLLLKQKKYRAVVSLLITGIFVSASIAWSMMASNTGDEMWP